MKSKRTTTATTTTAANPATATATTTTDRGANRVRTASLFDRDNLLWMLGAVVLIVLGFVLMSGGRSEDPNVFDPNEVYSTRRITIAPIVILAGLVLLIVAIFRHPKHR